jgi:hypothetical protein
MNPGSERNFRGRKTKPETKTHIRKACLRTEKLPCEVLEKMPCEALLVAAIRTWRHDGIDRCLISSTRKKTLKDILEVLDPGKDLQKESRIDHTDSSHPFRKKKTHIIL